MRFFNTAGPCEPDRHYMLPAAPRLPEARGLIDQGGYFVVHAPRQTGKTTTLRAIAKELAAEGRYAAVYSSCKVAEAAGEDVEQGVRAILDELRENVSAALPPELHPPHPWPDAPALTLLRRALSAWSHHCPLPLVLFLDEVDAMVGLTLRAVLSQLHAGYPERPKLAPWSVVLCGLRDIRDYREAAGKDPARFGSASPFNIKLDSLRLGDFSAADVRALYSQHSAQTGQPFEEAALLRVLEVTQGQPWLVNAIAQEIISKIGVTPPTPITADHVEQAKERLILNRGTHLDSLAARLGEARVQRVIEPVIAGDLRVSSAYEDDVEYVRDLGLFAAGRTLQIANPIYQEVIVRVLAAGVQRDIPVDPRSFVQADGQLDLGQILREFTAFYKEHGELLAGDLSYHEVAPQLVLMAYLQRVVNGGGYVAREYGIGRDRIDLLIRWPYTTPEGKREWQLEALELKVWRPKQADPLPAGLLQLDGYLTRLGLSHGALVIFDRRPSARSLAQRIRLSTRKTPAGRAAAVLRA